MQTPQHILDLIQKYQSGIISPGELEILNEWYHSFDDTLVEITGDGHITEKETGDRIQARLLETIGSTSSSKAPGMSRNWMMAASIIGLLLLGTAAYFVFSGRQSTIPNTITKITPPAKQDIAPGGDKAILILADGSPVILDSTHNGTINTQGNTRVIKLNTGKLSYQQDGSAKGSTEMVYNTIKTPRGGQYQVILSDGTGVWLNAASSIKFPVSFSGTERRVEITGEAYFEVAHDKLKPFIVTASNTQTEVLGTHFNINAYDDESSIKTTLLEGKVKVSLAGNQSGQKTLVLEPGQQSIIHHDAAIKLNSHADLEETMAWKNGRFQFTSATLPEILRQISRWYDVDIVYQDAVDLQFTGQLPRNEYASAVFEKLALTGEVQFRVEGKKVYVRTTSK